MSQCLVPLNAEARKWRWRHFHGAYGYSHMDRSEGDGRRDGASEAVEGARGSTGGGGLSAVMDQLIRGCAQQAAQLQNLPFDKITRIVAPKDTQRNALEALRAATAAGAERVYRPVPAE